MTTICPKCRAVRAADVPSPVRQCPSCSVAYAKASGDTVARGGAGVRSSGRGGIGGRSSAIGSIPRFKLFAVLVIAYVAWLGYQRVATGSAGTAAGASSISHAGRISSNPSTEQLTQLASSAAASDVMMYSATWCPNCAAAKSWLGQYGFKAQICEIDKDSACQAQLQTLDPQMGVPYLIVKGRHMKDGFDSDEFLAALTGPVQKSAN